MYLYQLSRRERNWGHVILTHSEKWAEDDFKKLLRTAHIEAIKKSLPNDGIKCNDRDLFNNVLSFLREHGFAVANTEFDVDESVGWSLLSNCWFDIENIKSALKNGAGKWVIASTDMRREVSEYGKWSFVAALDTYEEAKAELRRIVPEAHDEFDFYVSSKTPLDKPLYRIFKVPSLDEYDTDPTVTLGVDND